MARTYGGNISGIDMNVMDRLSSLPSSERGEVLSSLCALGNMIVWTRCQGEEMATQLKYNHEGVLIEQKAASRTVSLS